MSETPAMDLERFIDAQEFNYERALEEVTKGKKHTHWMWYVFPQLKALGSSDTAIHFGLRDITEAEAYLQHPVLGARLIAISKAILNHSTHDANSILGSPDDEKLRSSMTLFGAVAGADSVFQAVLNHFFNGEKDQKTLRIIA